MKIMSKWSAIGKMILWTWNLVTHLKKHCMTTRHQRKNELLKPRASKIRKKFQEMVKVGKIVWRKSAKIWSRETRKVDEYRQKVVGHVVKILHKICGKIVSKTCVEIWPGGHESCINIGLKVGVKIGQDWVATYDQLAWKWRKNDKNKTFC